MVTKVPEVTIYFWIVKILTTAMGESTSDYLVAHLDPAVAVGLGFLGFMVAMVIQFSVRKYIAWVYWFTALMVAVFGTMAADVLHVGFGVPYAVSATFFLVALVIIFIAWYASEKTLSIHSIYTTKREVFYWLTVLATFALGTATGDLTATTWGFGYLSSGILFAILILFVAILHYVTKAILGAEHRHQSRNAVLAFWAAYILTRPLGASFADWMGKASSAGGLGWGDGPVSLVLFIFILCFVAYLAATQRDVQTKVTARS
ncbi:MAG TPA: hypothetical protein VHZ04_00935 [Candidatus Paceibacterota bacterium]|jgi:uncharacterized membrane-anchored protein|nr:hypothetical protein [Candidatus Paceibacterota bacterium]